MPGERNSIVNNSFVYGYEQKAYFQYGANIIAGFDFYVARHFFIGYEAAYKFAYTDYKGVDHNNSRNAIPTGQSRR